MFDCFPFIIALTKLYSDTTDHLQNAVDAFTAAHPLSLVKANPADLNFIRTVCTIVTTRASAYTAAAVHALWELQRDSAAKCRTCRNDDTAIPEEGQSDQTVRGEEKVTIACNGSIMEKYPRFMTRCQSWLDKLTALSDERSLPGFVSIEMAKESSIFGAAVAAAETASPS